MGNNKSTASTSLDRRNTKSKQRTQPKISRSPLPPKPGSYIDLEYKEERQNSPEITHGMYVCVYVIYIYIYNLSLSVCLCVLVYVCVLLCVCFSFTLCLSPCITFCTSTHVCLLVCIFVF